MTEDSATGAILRATTREVVADMASILFRLNVEDYARWKPVFDEHSATRKDMGSK